MSAIPIVIAAVLTGQPGLAEPTDAQWFQCTDGAAGTRVEACSTIADNSDFTLQSRAFAAANIGDMFLEESRLEDAVGEFSRAIRLLPDYAYAHRRRVTKVLDGAILGNMFFEPSTRTRVSFGCAFNLLGGDVRETTGFQSSAITKGESLYDTARVLSGYSDVIAMRHPEEGSVAEFAEASRVPVINGGDGANEHPTQALLDLYTIKKEVESRGHEGIDGIRIAMIGAGGRGDRRPR